MNTQLQIQLADGEGAILRALGLIARRGFRLLEMRLTDTPGGRLTLDLIASADSRRSPEVLKRQLQRLVDVLEVRVQHPAPRRPFSPAEPPYAAVGALGEFGIRHRRSQAMPGPVPGGGTHVFG